MNRESAVGIFYSVCQEFQDQGLNGLMMYKIIKDKPGVTDAGGTVLGEPVEIPGIGHYVSFTDSEGNRVSLLQPADR